MTLMTIADTPHSIALGRRSEFFRFTPLYPLKDAAIDRVGLGLPVQQDCGCDCGDPARRGDLGDACDLRCRISIGLLELAVGRQRSACIFASLDCVTTCIGMYFHGSFGLPFGLRSLARCFWRSLRAIIIYFVMRLLVSRARTAQKAA